MIYYHGTNNSHEIEQEGFLGSELSEFTDGFSHVDNGVVFFTEDIEEAKEYGDKIIEIHLEGVKAYPFSDGNTEHFYAIASEINEQSWWEVVE